MSRKMTERYRSAWRGASTFEIKTNDKGAHVVVVYTDAARFAELVRNQFPVTGKRTAAKIAAMLRRAEQ